MRTIQDAVLSKQVGLLYEQSKTAVFAGVGIAVFVTCYYWRVASTGLLLAWFATLLLLVAARVMVLRRFKRVSRYTFDAGLWLRRHLVMTFVSGTVWGLLSLFYDPAWPVVHQVVLFVTIAGLAAGSMSAYSGMLENYVVFLIPLLLPLEVGLFLRGDPTTTFLGGIVFLFAFGLLLVARNLYLQVIDSIHLSLSHQFLQQELSQGTDRLQLAESALRSSERRFGQVLESSLEGYWDWDIDSDTFYLSPRWKAQIGYADVELPNTYASWESRLHPDERGAMIQKLQAYIHKPWGSWEEKYRLRHKDGSYRWILARGRPTLDAGNRLVRLTGVHIDLTERVMAEGRAKYLAYHDWLTDLPNRLLFNDRVDQAIAQAKSSGGRLGILFFDLDRFKHINDSLGHPAGDRVLRVVADRLRLVVRETDTLARLGGDEFALLMENVSRSNVIALVAEKLLACFEEPFEESGRDFYLNASIGICVYPRDGESTAELLKNADAAMYKAKGSGRGTFQFYTGELTDNAYQHITLETGLRQALLKRQFEVHYQPKVSLRTGRVVGLEALLRWRHPDLGFIPPQEFIPVAEESGLIREIGDWILSNACRDAMCWVAAGLDFGHVAVNLSGAQIQSDAFIDRVEQILDATSLPPEYLELEITENILMRDAEASADYLRDLRELGVSISIDDFGTGYSSLAHLTRFPINKLKIDRSFVKHVCEDSQSAEISRTIIGLGHALDMQVVAEGIEHLPQLEFMRREDCDEAQGFYISEALSKDEIEVFIRRDNRSAGFTGGRRITG